jgi:acetyl esterase/lipase
MSTGFHRVVADRLCDTLRAVLPNSLAHWGDALRAEIATIPDDGEAFRFALESFFGLLPRALIARGQTAMGAIIGHLEPTGDTKAMRIPTDRLQQPIIAGALCAIVATALGLIYMAAAGAPLIYLGINFGALVAGLALLAVSARASTYSTCRTGSGILFLAILLLATSMFGRSVEGATRWVSVGPLFVQTSLLFLPAIIIGFVRVRTFVATIGVLIAALALALQPDRAMAGVLAAGVAPLAVQKFDRFTGVALLGALAAFVFTLTRPEALPAVPFVDQVYYTAFEVNYLAGAAVLLGSAILLIPAVLGWRATGAERATALVFGAMWIAVMLAAALGNYPTPVVGYGGSAIVGYLLSLAALPRSMSRHVSKEAEQGTEPRHKGAGRLSFIKTLSAAGIILGGATGAAGQENADDCSGTVVEKVEFPNTIWQPGPEGEQIALWPDEVELDLPDYDGNSEMIGSGSPLVAGRTWNWATYISRPTMTIYKPKGENTGAAMLVLPGGGYAAVAMDLEGAEICDWITQHGVTCVVLKYRAPQVWRRENGVGIPPERLFALEDAQRAMSLLRDRSATYEIDPDRIGVIGFSAGAHLATALSNEEGAAYTPVDAADAQPSRPDYAIVMYLGRSLARRNPDMDLSLGPWVKISADAPPTLLIHAMNDSANDVRHSIAYGLALDKVGVPVDMRFYAAGCHAFGLRPTSDPITTEWPIEAVRWLRSINML